MALQALPSLSRASSSLLTSLSPYITADGGKGNRALPDLSVPLGCLAEEGQSRDPPAVSLNTFYDKKDITSSREHWTSVA